MHGSPNQCYVGLPECTGKIILHHIKTYGRFWICEHHVKYLKDTNYTIGIISNDRARAGAREP